MSTAIPLVTKLSERVIRILGCNPGVMTLQGTNTYLIGKGNKRILLDTGEDDAPDYLSQLKKVLKEENVSLQLILISHWHHDHVGGIANILKELNLDCNIIKLPRSLEEVDIDPSPIKKYTYLKDGDTVKTDGATLKLFHTPGHTTDHMVVLLEEEKALFSGDCILGEGTAVFEDLQSYMQSLNKILKLEPIKIYPGHGPDILDPVPKIKSYIDHRHKRELEILKVLGEHPDNPMSVMDIVKIVYKNTPSNLHPAAAFNVEHHLSKLHKDNKIEKRYLNEEDKYVMAQ